MKLIKVLLSTMFLFSAVIRSTEVGTCGSRIHRFEGIRANYDVLNGAGTKVSEGTACEASWPSLESAIKFNLKQRQIIADYNLVEIAEHRRLIKEAKDVVGAEIKGE